MKLFKEIGVLSNYNCRNYKGYVTFCGVYQEKQFAFREEYGDYSNLILISPQDKCELVKKIPYGNILSLCCYDEQIYLLLKNPTRIFVLNKDMKLKQSVEIEEEIFPIHISATSALICVSGKPGKILLFDRKTLSYIKTANTGIVGVNKPMFVGHDFEGLFLIVDSTAHTVKLIDENANLKFSYGVNNEPGSEFDHLNSPVYACKTGKGILISENRNHRSLEVSFNKEILSEYGRVNNISAYQNGLWNPQGVYVNGNIYMVMCKGCHINIKFFNNKKKILENVFGSERVLMSSFNFPRSCDYSLDKDILIISDTYHNRILAFNSAGKQLSSISTTSLGMLDWPRCSIWHNEEILIGDSRNNRILFSDFGGEICREIKLDKIGNGEWIQAIYLIGEKLLVAFETEVYVLNIETLEILWDSKSCGIKLDDVHHALFTPNMDIIISDTGHQRLVWIKEFHEIQYIKGFAHNNTFVRLQKPRCTLIDGNNLFVLNSDIHMILQVDIATMSIKDLFGGKRGYAIDKISKPRWICKGPANIVYVTDTDNNRVVAIEFDKEK